MFALQWKPLIIVGRYRRAFSRAWTSLPLTPSRLHLRRRVHARLRAPVTSRPSKWPPPWFKNLLAKDGEPTPSVFVIEAWIGATSIADIDNLVSELQEARDYLQSEGERIRAETVRYISLTGAASASVKIIFDALRAWRTAGHSAHNQSQASAFEITDAVIEDASDWGDGPSRSFG